MAEVAIRVEHLSKQYRIGRQGRYWTLRDTLTDALRAPLRGLSRLLNSQSDDTIWALRDVSFEVKHGEVLGIIGRNGAGKSTLLKILSRITEPTEGFVEIQGRVGSLLEVGTGFHTELTGRENLYLNGAILGMKRGEIQRKFDEIVAFAEVEQFIDTPVKHYSSGMYLRLAFAVAAHLEPDILLVDEVLAVGDAAFQKKCLGKMGDVAKAGRTVLFVSHNMPAIQATCHDVLLLQSGKLKVRGHPDTVISDYHSEGLDRTSSDAELSNHPRRSRCREAALRRAWILNGNGLRTNSIGMGKGMTVCFHFQLSRALRNLGVGLGIEDEHGRRIFSLNNYMAPSKTDSLRSNHAGVASFQIPELPLLPGTYFISLSLVEDQREWVDFVERALTLHVHPADVRGSGKIPDRTQGVVFVAGEITINPDDSMSTPVPERCTREPSEK